MKNQTKQIHSDRFISIRSRSAPKNTLINHLAQTTGNKNRIQPDVLCSSSSSLKHLTWAQSLTTKETSIRQFMKNPISTNCTSNNTILEVDPYRYLGADNLVDNFYYNTMDMSKDDVVALGLGSELFTFREKDSVSICFNRKEGHDSLLTCVKYSLSDSLLMAGDEDGSVQVYDVQRVSPIRTFRPHTLKLGRIQNHHTQPYLIFTGAHDYSVKLNDLRIKKTVVKSFDFQKSPICGLSLKDNFLATGSNDGKIGIWDIRNVKLMTKLAQHEGAVKALSWCPWKKSILASGGGKKDREIVLYNHLEQKIQGTIPSKNQITQICWRESTQQILYTESRLNPTSRGGKIKISNYFNPKTTKVHFKKLNGRILAIKISKKNDGILATLSGDQNLAYWDISKAVGKLKATDLLDKSNFGQQ